MRCRTPATHGETKTVYCMGGSIQPVRLVFMLERAARFASPESCLQKHVGTRIFQLGLAFGDIAGCWIALQKVQSFASFEAFSISSQQKASFPRGLGRCIATLSGSRHARAAQGQGPRCRWMQRSQGCVCSGSCSTGSVRHCLSTRSLSNMTTNKMPGTSSVAQAVLKGDIRGRRATLECTAVKFPALCFRRASCCGYLGQSTGQPCSASLGCSPVSVSASQ